MAGPPRTSSVLVSRSGGALLDSRQQNTGQGGEILPGRDNSPLVPTEGTIRGFEEKHRLVRLLRQGTSGATRVDFLDLVDAPSAAVSDPAAPGLALQAPRPNPAGLSVEVRFSLASSAQAALEVFDLSGRLVSTLVSGPMPAGDHGARWDLRDGRGQRVEAGVYFIRLGIPGSSLVRRVAVLP